MRNPIVCATVAALALVVGGLTDLRSESQTSSVRQPRKIKDVAPVYPVKSLAAGDEGAVVVELKVSAAGSVTDARVIWSKCPALNEAALTAARSWQYEVFRVNGKGTAFAVTAPVSFRLPEELKWRAGRSESCKWIDPPAPTR